MNVTVVIPTFPVRYQTVGGAQITATARPGSVGRVFRATCGGCGDLVSEYDTQSACHAWLRVRGRKYRPTPAEVDHFEGIAWNLVRTSCNMHASQCRRVPERIE